ncbi:MAG TPA: pyridoxamine 5'-phosphate oxidase family protein [Thermoanaerobaculia bacterium]|nr:pyridoxamine 5'-phosphate oxidase family protein [Thermoanaerobaculia bacterium]
MSNGRKKLFEMIEDMQTAMFTTRRANGQLVSRPMANQERSAGADLWFVTYEGAKKLKEIERDSHVNLTYYKDRTREWVSISGRAKISRDRKKIKELYKPDWRAWFGDDGGPKAGTADDPRMVLIGVTITSATFMEQDKPTPVVVFELIKGIITKKPPKLGKERTVGKTSRPAKRR